MPCSKTPFAANCATWQRRVFAIAAARYLWAEAIINGHDLLHDRIEITNETGDRLAVIPFTDALSEAVQKRMGVRGESASSAGA